MRSLLVLSIVASGLGTASAADLESGLLVGDYPHPFFVMDVTGPAAGEKLCYRCRYGAQPVVNIFARKLDENVTKLIKEIDGVVAKNRDSRMAAFVVVLTEDPDEQETVLKKTVQSGKIKHTPLTIFENSSGPAKYRIAKEADVTVMMWVESDVKVNHALKHGELNDEAISRIVKDTAKILN